MFRLAVLTIPILLTSCGTTQAIHVKGPEKLTLLNPSPRPLIPRKAETVELFLAARPERPVVEVGTWSRFGAPEKTVQGMRKEAAVVGCDALLLSERVTTTPGTPARTTYNTDYGKPGVSGDRYSTTTPGTPPQQHVQTVAVCAVYSDVAASHRPEPHPCYGPMKRVREAKNEDKRAAIEDAPSECLRLFPPTIPVAESREESANGAPPPGSGPGGD